MKKYITPTSLVLLAAALSLVLSCGSSSAPEPGGTVTVSGTLAVAAANVSPELSLTKAASGESYIVHILNTGTGEQTTATADSSGNFSVSGVGNSHYVISVLDSNKNFVGTLETGAASGSTIPVALTTGGDQTTTDLGTVSANATTGLITSDQTLSADTSQLAYTSDGTTIAGGKTGTGSTDYTTEVGATACTTGTATCPDLDHDGIPDVFDNDNNGKIDEVDGKVDLCVPTAISLHINNYTTAANAAQPGFPTPAEVDADLPGNSMYQLHLEMTPNTGYSISDISEVSVTTPSYIDLYGYVYHVANTHACFNTLWTACNGKKMMLSDDGTKYEMALADTNLTRAGVLVNMQVGDTFIFNIAMADGTTHTCTRKINAIPKYFPYEIKKAGTLIDTFSHTQTGWTGSFAISWTLPTQLPAGLVYIVRVVPYTAGCLWDPDNYTEFSAGADGTSVTLDNATLPASPVAKWGMNLDFTDAATDDSYTGWINFTSSATDPCSNP